MNNATASRNMSCRTHKDRQFARLLWSYTCSFGWGFQEISEYWSLERKFVPLTSPVITSIGMRNLSKTWSEAKWRMIDIDDRQNAPRSRRRNDYNIIINQLFFFWCTNRWSDAKHFAHAAPSPLSEKPLHSSLYKIYTFPSADCAPSHWSSIWNSVQSLLMEIFRYEIMYWKNLSHSF